MIVNLACDVQPSGYNANKSESESDQCYMQHNVSELAFTNLVLYCLLLLLLLCCCYYYYY